MTRPVLVLVLLCVGCEEDPCPRGSMLDSDGGLIVTEAEHPTGWGVETCSECHAEDVLHRRGCTAVDLQDVRDDVDDGVPCSYCHGNNGVDP